MERWRPVPGFPWYAVSTFGRVRRLRGTKRFPAGTYLVPSKDTKGKHIVGLCREAGPRLSFTMPHLVALTWAPGKSKTHRYVGFRDGDRSNYQAENLYWTDVHPGKGTSRKHRIPHRERTRWAKFLAENPDLSLKEAADKLGCDVKDLLYTKAGKDYTPRPRLSPDHVSKAQFTPPANPEVEEWRQIPGSPGYDVSSFGRVRTWRRLDRDGNPIILTQFEGNSGYLQVTVSKTRGVANLVAEAFCPRSDPSKNTVDHIKEKHNNRFDALQWATQLENTQNAFKTGKAKAHTGRRKHYARPSKAEIQEALNRGISVAEVAVELDTFETFVTASLDDWPWTRTTPEPLPGEVWQSPPDHSSIEVSNKGRIRRKNQPNRLLKIAPNDRGYILARGLTPDTPQPGSSKWVNRSVHYLVLATFGPPKPDSEKRIVINHLNGEKFDNSIENLEWATDEENMRHAWEAGLQPSRDTSTPASTSFPEDLLPESSQVREIPDYPGYWITSSGDIWSLWRKTPTLMATYNDSKNVKLGKDQDFHRIDDIMEAVFSL